MRNPHFLQSKKSFYFVISQVWVINFLLITGSLLGMSHSNYCTKAVPIVLSVGKLHYFYLIIHSTHFIYGYMPLDIIF